MSKELYYKCSSRLLHNNLLETHLSRSHLPDQPGLKLPGSKYTQATLLSSIGHSTVQ